MGKRYWIGFDLGGTKMLAAVYDEQYECLGRSRKKTKGFQGEKAGLDRVVKCIHDAINDADRSVDDLQAIGIGCPGPVDPGKGILLQAPNLGWKNVPISAELSKEFDKPVVLTNDVDAGVFGEYRFGAGKGAKSLLGVFPGTGIGGGFVYNGEIFQGANISCMEIGHIPTIPNGPIASAGLPGSLESVSSRLSIASLVAQAAYRGEAPLIVEQAGTDLSNIRSGLLADAIKQEEPIVTEIISRAIIQLGRSVAGFVHMLAPERIVLGGGLAEAMPEFMLQKIHEGMQEWLLPEYRKVSDVVVAKLGDDASVQGAAAWARHVLEQKAK
ncbi:MAG: ROK family protein [Planctomycetaceae bacterium]|nr:ROK family protein [Planctomycetaceae bacterium]